MKKFLSFFVPFCIYFLFCGILVYLVNMVYGYSLFLLSQKTNKLGLNFSDVKDASKILYIFYWIGLAPPMFTSLYFLFRYKTPSLKTNLVNLFYRSIAIIFDGACSGIIVFSLPVIFLGPNVVLLVGFLMLGYGIWKLIALISSSRNNWRHPCGIYWSIEFHLEKLNEYRKNVEKRKTIYNIYLNTNKF